MKKLIAVAVVTVLVLGLSLVGCVKTSISPDDENIHFTIPSGWPQPHYDFVNNTLTPAGFSLGRKLFYDPRLSRDNTISCASCHQQFAAFCHLDHSVSHGIYGLLGTRNAPGLSNTGWNTTFFWDGGVNNLENQPINPIQNHVEMDMTLPEIITKIGADADYRARFKRAFGDETVNSQRIFKAMAQFMGAMVSSGAKYDKYMRGESGGEMTAQELSGLSLFRMKCEGCHKEPLFSDYSFRNNGLMPNSAVNDSGRAHITRSAADLYKFKVPSLRNVDLTMPYMHDGRLQTLDACVEHYRTGIYASATLDPLLVNGISMTDSEKADIIVFLKTLSDTTFTKDKRFSDPAQN